MDPINYPAVLRALKEALAWGMVYGPIIPAQEWDSMRDEKAQKLMTEILSKKV